MGNAARRFAASRRYARRQAGEHVFCAGLRRLTVRPQMGQVRVSGFADADMESSL